MSRNAGYLQYVLEEIIPDTVGVSARGMFGGYGLYINGVIFGLIIQDQLYFKINDQTRPEYEKRGSEPFSYEGKQKKIVSLNYYSVPLEIMENRDEIVKWIEIAYTVGKLSKK